MPRISQAPLPPPEARRVAVAADVDPRTVATYIAGKRVLPAVAARIADALRGIGRGDLIPATAAPSPARGAA